MFMDFAGASFYDTVTLEYADERAKETLAVEKEALALYVFAIEGCLHWDFKLVAAINLSPAGQTHRYIVCTVLVAFCNQVVLVPQSRARADDAHGPFENIEHLREFIEASLAEESTYLGNPLFRVAQFMRRGILWGVGAHGAELIDVKMLLVQAHALLLEEHGSLAVQLDGDGNGEHRECQHHNAETGKDDIKKSLKKECIGSLMHDRSPGPKCAYQPGPPRVCSRRRCSLRGRIHRQSRYGGLQPR